MDVKEEPLDDNIHDDSSLECCIIENDILQPSSLPPHSPSDSESAEACLEKVSRDSHIPYHDGCHWRYFARFIAGKLFQVFT